MIRKLTAISFIAVFLFNLCGYYFIFLAEQNDMRSEMRSLIHSGKMNESAETIFAVNPYNNPDLRWVDNTEFFYNGHLYDLISMSHAGNEWTITCIKDAREEQLITDYRHYSDLLAENSFPARSHQGQVLSQLLITSALITEQDHPAIQEPKDFSFSEFSYRLSIIPESPPTPPPKKA